MASFHSRRDFLRLTSTAVAMPALSSRAWALDYPTRPIRLVAPYAAGGAVDVAARLLAQWLSERLGRQVFVENRPGAGTNIGTEAVVRAAPDGYTLLFASPANATNATLYDKLSFNFVRDIAPVAGLLRVPNVMEVTPSLPVKSVPEFITYAKNHPGELSYASPATGSSIHLSAELFKAMTQIDLINVTYRGFGAGGYTDLMTGRVHVAFDNITGSIEYIRAGKLRALAVTTAARSDVLPDIPTVADFVPGYEVSAWYGICAPRNTPVEIVERLNREINAAFVDPQMRKRFAELGGMALPGSPNDFGRLIFDETEKWAKVIKGAGIKVVE